MEITGIEYYKKIPLLQRIQIKQIAESKAITMTGERVQSVKEMSALLEKIIEFCSKVPTYEVDLNQLLESTFRVHKHIIYLKDGNALAYDSKKECIGRFEDVATAAKGVNKWYCFLLVNNSLSEVITLYNKSN